MTAGTWARFGLVWSACWLVFSVYHAAVASVLGLALVHAACALAHLWLCIWALRAGRLSRRLLAFVAEGRRADRAQLRAVAWAGVWTDRAAAFGPRHPRTMAAHLGMLSAVACFEVVVAEGHP